MSVNVVAIQVCNFIDKSVIISRRARLDRIIEYEEHECYLTNSKKASLVVDSIWKKSKSSFADESFRHKTFALTNIHISMKNLVIKFMKKIIINEIIVYDISEVRKQLFNIAMKFDSALWDKTENFMIHVLENIWMSIILKSETKIEAIKM